MLSNSDPTNYDANDDFFKKHYNFESTKIEQVKANRSINSNGKGRKKINELIIINY